MKNLIWLIISLLSLQILAQHHSDNQYFRPEKTRKFDLIHTKLKVSFDFENQELDGEAYIKAKPYFYPSNLFTLDAKGMYIEAIKLHDIPLDYNYDGMKLRIDLGKEYTREETFEVYIKYTAKPERLKDKVSSNILEGKGLYFIDPKDNDPDKPTQIWTQGATESNSCWFPTIDSPNQKMTEDIYISVPEKYTTLSNGLLVEQTNHDDQIRTDHWKLDQPNAPYLFFIGIGKYALIKDKWQDIEVNYYVEPEYKDLAMDIFGLTPEMIQFFSDKFDYPYPWPKYSQISGRDFIMGAMENTTATLHAEDVQQRKGQLVDENLWEDTIAHELSHHWFGDLVTAESWSQISLNESFATYCEYLWREYKYGQDYANAHLLKFKNDYLAENNEDKNLVRYQYTHRNDIFDAVSYQKGALVLHMLRQYVGDEAFFKALSLYLKDYAYKATEVEQLRLVFEEVTGRDLNLFFNQWFYGHGHPKITVDYQFNEDLHQVEFNLYQGGKIVKMPLQIEVYESGIVARHQVELSKKVHHFTFNYTNTPDLILLNPNQGLLAEITDTSKSLKQYIFQYKNAKYYHGRREAIDFLLQHQADKEVFNTLSQALDDPYYKIRIQVLENLDLSNKYHKKETIKKVEKLAVKDPKTMVRGAALGLLGKLINPVYKPLFEKGIQETSYAIKENTILSLYELDKPTALEQIKTLTEEEREDLSVVLTRIYMNEKDETQLAFIAKHFIKILFTDNYSRYYKDNFEDIFQWVGESDNKEAIQNLTDDLVEKGKRYKKYDVDKLAISLLQRIVDFQQKSDNNQKEALILIAKQGLVQLLE